MHRWCKIKAGYIQEIFLSLTEEVMNMGENKDKKKKEKKIIEEQPLQPCTTAPSAEHARGHEDDEPCDDGRTGKPD